VPAAISALLFLDFNQIVGGIAVDQFVVGVDPAKVGFSSTKNSNVALDLPERRMNASHPFIS
jgi:hypothetical protein